MSARLVIADDSDTILALVTIAVKKDGYEPATATNGTEALEVIREHRPELVILDALMPGMTGYEVCRALREDVDAPRPHVMMLTAGAREADKALAAEVGIDEFIAKPFSPLALRARVREILGDP
jgi:two-component system, OmpR family, alkaline phosphatase synthesis response regulator PhoP